VKSAAFEYVRAESIGEACEALKREGDSVKLIAGGQSLVPLMAMRLVRPAWLVDINEISALKFITLADDGRAKAVRIGTCTRQSVAERDEALAEHVPLLRQAIAYVGHVQTRNRGTIGGSIAHADPCAELPLVAQILGADIVLRSSAATRTLSAETFFAGPMTTAAGVDECIEEVRWPIWDEPRTGSAFTEISSRHGDFAMVSAGAQIALDDEGRCVRAAFGLGGVGPTPLSFPKLAQRLVGTRMEDEVIRSATEDAAGEADPGSDLFATAAYRRHLARVLATRAISAAAEQARGKS